MYFNWDTKNKTHKFFSQLYQYSSTLESGKMLNLIFNSPNVPNLPCFNALLICALPSYIFETYLDKVFGLVPLWEQFSLSVSHANQCFCKIYIKSQAHFSNRAEQKMNNKSRVLGQYQKWHTKYRNSDNVSLKAKIWCLISKSWDHISSLQQSQCF